MPVNQMTRALLVATLTDPHFLENLVFFLYAGFLGACIGSFLNVVVYRWPLGLSIVSPPSRCPRCSKRLLARDNIPVLGWILRRGRCRWCDQPISFRYPLIEAIVGLFAMLIPLEWTLSSHEPFSSRIAVSVSALIAFVMLCFLLVAYLLERDAKPVPRALWITLPILAIALMILALAVSPGAIAAPVGLVDPTLPQAAHQAGNGDQVDQVNPANAAKAPALADFQLLPRISWALTALGFGLISGVIIRGNRLRTLRDVWSDPAVFSYAAVGAFVGTLPAAAVALVTSGIYTTCVALRTQIDRWLIPQRSLLVLLFTMPSFYLLTRMLRSSGSTFLWFLKLPGGPFALMVLVLAILAVLSWTNRRIERRLPPSAMDNQAHPGQAG